ncbi:MAG TPA: hypothetical protein VLK25_06230 [Allosphingosinicella sp.]|nr:hypothetical protein [Allosphingosinicella sp.]
MTTTYYSVTLATDIPPGSNILEKPCQARATYPDKSHSSDYPGTIFAWPTQNSVCIASAYMNMEAAWIGATGGTLTISTGGGAPLSYAITAFCKMP